MPSNMGSDGFLWFVGVVEDRHDPQKLGRVRVRALGTHTSDKTRIKTDDLPWAHVMQPVSSNAIAGIGDSPVNLVEGTWVVGFFRDVDSRQELVVMGTLPGYNVTTPVTGIPKGVKNRGEYKTSALQYVDASGERKDASFDDYEWGFFDPTNDLSSVPFEADPQTYVPADESSSGSVTKITDDKEIRVPSYEEVAGPPTALSTTTPIVGTQSAGLVETFTTTRRLTIDKLLDSGESYGSSQDAPTVLAGDPTLDNKPLIASTGYLQSGTTQGTEGAWWPLTMNKTDEDRMPHPRIEKVKKSDLTTTQSAEIEKLFEEGIYGPLAKWADVDGSSEVVLPRADTNRLAQGGYAIGSISGGTITLATYKVKPSLVSGDSIQIAGVVGMETLNGQIFSLSGASLSATSGTLSFTLPSTEEGTYVSGGVVLVNPHPVLRDKADTREKLINAGGPDLDYPISDGSTPEAAGTYSAYWNQPTSRYGAQYPYNKVFESESGHIKEYDDTPGAERIHEYHRAGTFYEIDANGMKVDFVKGDNYNIRVHDDFLYVKGKIIWTGDDEILLHSNDTLSLSAKWRLKVASGGDIDVYTKRNLNFRADGDINMQAGGNINLQADVMDSDNAKFKYAAGTRKKEQLSKINIQAGGIWIESPDPKSGTIDGTIAGGLIQLESYTSLTQKVLDGQMDTWVIKGDKGLGTITTQATGDIHTQSDEGAINIKATLSDINTESGGTISDRATTSINLQSAAINQKASGAINSIASGGENSIVGTKVNLNSGGSAPDANEIEAVSDIVASIDITEIDLKVPKDAVTLSGISTTTRDNERSLIKT